MHRFLPLLFLALPFASFSQDEPLDDFLARMEAKVPGLFEDFACPGAALAIIEDGKVVYQKGLGLADVASSKPVTTKTGFNIGSVSKTIAAWGVMHLVEAGKIDLDAPAETYLTRWHLPPSEYDHDGVTIRRMLSHTAGLSLHGYPGWGPEDTLPTIEESLDGKNNGPGRVEVVMEPGSRYQYSGGGFTILQLIIEEVTGQSFADYIDETVLHPLGMTSSGYTISEEILAASASEYDRYHEELDFEYFTAQAAAGFHTTIEDFTRFALANLYGMEQDMRILKAETLEEMMTNVPQAQGHYGYGLGYITETIEGGDLYLAGHRGANDGWHAIYKVDPQENDGFLMLTNCGAGFDVYNPVYCEWVKWKCGVPPNDWCDPQPSVGVALKGIIDQQGIEAAPQSYHALREDRADDYDFSESQLNNLGYHFLENEEFELAEAVFKLNTEAFPGGYNAWDSYAESLMVQGKKDAAIEYYRKSVNMYPGNLHGISQLKELGADITDLVHTVPEAQLELLTGAYTNLEDPSWVFEFEVVDGLLAGHEGDNWFQLAPKSDHEFAVVGNEVFFVFDTKDPSNIRCVLGGDQLFNKRK